MALRFPGAPPLLEPRGDRARSIAFANRVTAGTGWVDARRALEDDDVGSGSAQSNRCGQAADPSANDDDAHSRDDPVSGRPLRLRRSSSTM